MFAYMPIFPFLSMKQSYVSLEELLKGGMCTEAQKHSSKQHWLPALKVLPQSLIPQHPKRALQMKLGKSPTFISLVVLDFKTCVRMDYCEAASCYYFSLRTVPCGIHYCPHFFKDWKQKSRKVRLCLCSGS